LRTAVKLVAGITLAVAAAVSGFSVAAADPVENYHNCAGADTTFFSGPGFGQIVAAFAQAQLVDNFGSANCGETNRKNP